MLYTLSSLLSENPALALAVFWLSMSEISATTETTFTSTNSFLFRPLRICDVYGSLSSIASVTVLIPEATNRRTEVRTKDSIRPKKGNSQ
jgi:hypothetical protein